MSDNPAADISGVFCCHAERASQGIVKTSGSETASPLHLGGGGMLLLWGYSKFIFLRLLPTSTKVVFDAFPFFLQFIPFLKSIFNHLNDELNPLCHLLALLGAHQILHVSRIRINFTHERSRDNEHSLYTSINSHASSVLNFRIGMLGSMFRAQNYTQCPNMWYHNCIFTMRKFQLFLFFLCCPHCISPQKPCDPYRLATGHERIAENTNWQSETAKL